MRIALREERTSILSWGIGLFLYLLMIGSSYATVEGNEELEKLWDDMPDGLKEAFGGDVSITAVDGYYISQAGALLPILFGTYLLLAATKRLAGAEGAGRLDHLLARPISRAQFYWHFGAALGAAFGLMLVATWAGTVLGFLVGGAGAGDLLRLSGAMLDQLPAAILWWGLGLFLGTAFHRRPPALGVAMGALIGLYAINIIAGVVKWNWLTYATPYGLFAKSDMYHGDPNLAYWLALPILGIGFAFAGARVFARKNLY